MWSLPFLITFTDNINRMVTITVFLLFVLFGFYIWLHKATEITLSSFHCTSDFSVSQNSKTNTNYIFLVLWNFLLNWILLLCLNLWKWAQWGRFRFPLFDCQRFLPSIVPPIVFALVFIGLRSLTQINLCVWTVHSQSLHTNNYRKANKVHRSKVGQYLFIVYV